MMQPTFLPWQGFFGLIVSADLFVMLDDFQFSPQSWQQRNRLFVETGRVDWVTVPVRKAGAFGSPLDEILVDDSKPWRKKMLRRISQSYARCEYHARITSLMEDWLESPAKTLSELNVGFVRRVLDLWSCDTTLVHSRTIGSSGHRSVRVLELLESAGAETYLAAPGSFEYMREDAVFPLPGMEVLFQEFRDVPYPQAHSEEFVPRLSILDALYNVGPTHTLELVRRGTGHWLTWDEMSQASGGAQ